MATQLPRAERLAAADDVIDNSGPREALAPQVERLDRRYRELARHGARHALIRSSAWSSAHSGRMTAFARCRRHAVILYEHPLNERIRTLMRLEDLFARAHYFAGRDGAPRASCRAAVAVRDHRRRVARRPEDRPAAGARAAEAGARSAAQQSGRSTSRRSTRCSPRSTQVNARPARAGRQGRHAPARERMADGDQAARGDSRRRVRVRPARLPLLAEQGAGGAAAATSPAGSSRSSRSASGSAIVLRLLRENGRVSRHTAYRGVFQLMLTTTKVAQLLRLTLQRDLPCVPGDQRQQVRAQHPLHRRFRHGSRQRRRPGRRVRADVLQPLN